MSNTRSLRDRTLNFSSVNMLLFDDNDGGLQILKQIANGFGVRNVHACKSYETACEAVRSKSLDIAIVDQEIADGKGLDFVKFTRRDAGRANATLPIILAVGHATLKEVAAARDCGANYLIRKPISSASLLERIIKVIDDPRPFIEAKHYAGPDRRFKFEGPPVGSNGRRDCDSTTELSEQADANMSQHDVDSMFSRGRA